MLRGRERELTDSHGESWRKTLLALAKPFVMTSQVPQEDEASSASTEEAAEASVPKTNPEPRTLPVPMIIALALLRSSPLVSVEALNPNPPAGILRVFLSPARARHQRPRPLVTTRHIEGIAIHESGKATSHNACLCLHTPGTAARRITDI